MKVGFPPADALALTESEAAAFLEAYVDISAPKGSGGLKASVERESGVGRRRKRKR